ncbi:MAG: hypothetical protein CMI09_12880 [Oceanospirillaceae bacterium]|nr:hypothetical protein [Oceanospirillaceae bacterium]
MKKMIWLLWLVSTLALAGFLGYELAYEKEKPNFLIGKSTHGHYQIELACDACHTSPFGGEEVLQDACVSCHGDELKASLDSHPKKKFTDPRNADLISVLDARQCVSCHSEHNPDITHPMGLTLPEDYCVQCHADVGEERPTHKGLTFETCASAGCHNYHDNRALYEDFLLKHAHDRTPSPQQLLPSTLKQYLASQRVEWPEENLHSIKGHAQVQAVTTPEIEHEWLSSAHGQAGVGCNSCHTSAPSELWIEKPGHQQCQSCHTAEVKGFLAGKHGMRLAQKLSPMTPEQARQPMQTDAGHAQLGCNSCHNAHTDNRIAASTEACLGCHADDHSLAFEQSPHGQLWQQVLSGERTAEEAVSCATCHMPRESVDHYGDSFTQVQHNQNATLRPNEKMIRSSCMSCHTLAFSIDALADEKLINNNFSGSPDNHIESIDMAVSRDVKHR